MSTQVQYRRGSNVQVAAFTGALGELVIDTTNKVVVVNDGVTVGGFPQVGLTASQTLTNKIYQGTSLSVSGNVTGGNITTGGVISATGNITGGNIIGTIVGTISTTSASVSGNITGGNLLTGGVVSATGNVTGNYLLGNAYFVTGLSPTQIYSGTSNVTVTGSGANISVGVGGTPNVAVWATTGQYVTGVISASGNITAGGNISAVGNINLADTQSVRIGSLIISDDTIRSSEHNITIGSLGNIGNVIIGGNLTVNGNTTTINSNTVSTNDLTYNLANNASTSAQANGGGIEVGPVGSPYITWLYNNTSNVWTTAGGISATGNITGGNVLGGANVNATTHTGTTVSVTGNITGGNVLGGANVNATTHTGATVSVTGSITAGGDISLVGNIVDTGALTITTSSNGNITLSPNGTGVIIASKDIVNGQANGVGNIGSSTTYFNTVFAKATSAQYADLAEMYCADFAYAPGTVLDFGGDKEVTATTQSHSTCVAGIVSTHPSYLMNSALDCTNAIEVALVGRVPCRVVGTIAKGDRLVSSSTPGVATRLDMAQYQPGCIIGKALEAYNSDTVGTIEVAVGRF
jgi:trimeric autotransporter adhesin